jgi:hypothetical protein
LSFRTELFQEASRVAEDGNLVGLGRLPGLQDGAELTEPGALHDREVELISDLVGQLLKRVYH